ncbi:related to protein SSH4 [Zygosaccharomyces bailii]|nr:related to protein SSH4 [Zygosaccharomyces bailii]
MFVPLDGESVVSFYKAELDSMNDPYPGPPMDDSGTISLAFLISLSVTFALLMLILVVVAVYVTFCGADEAEYDEEVGGGGRNGNGGLHSFFNKKRSGILLDSSFTSPGQFDDEAALEQQEAQELPRMSEFEVELYNHAKEFQKVNPPNVREFGTFLNESDLQFITDRGMQSYFFLPSINDNTDAQGNFLPSLVVQDKLDVTFTKYNKSSSTVMNYPLPFNKKAAVYFEVKVFKHQADSNAIFSIGLTTCPYPYFRPPGMSIYSIAYESTGKLRINNPFMASTLLPKLQEGDVVGFGYRYRTGTIFITHNGKKLMDVTQNVGIDLFVSLGSMNAAFTRTYTRDGLLEDPDNVDMRDALAEAREISLPKDLQRVHDIRNESELPSDEVELNVNLGQLGFVFVEANVKKYAFGSLFGEIGVPPSYNGAEIKKDTVLQKGEDLPPKYADGEDRDSFFGNININVGSSVELANSAAPDAPTDSNTVEGASGSASREPENYERHTSSYDREQNFTEEEESNDNDAQDAQGASGEPEAGTADIQEQIPLIKGIAETTKSVAKSNTKRYKNKNKKNKNKKKKFRK